MIFCSVQICKKGVSQGLVRRHRAKLAAGFCVDFPHTRDPSPSEFSPRWTFLMLTRSGRDGNPPSFSFVVSERFLSFPPAV